MPDLSWDAELATVAQRWLEQCHKRFDHDQCRDVKRFRVGQNYVFTWSVSGSTDWTGAVSHWFDSELPVFTQTDLIFTDKTDRAGHLTQVIWAKTKKVGCGFIAYTTDIGSITGTRREYLCNYGPAGNVFSLPIYEAASGCS